MKRLDFMTLTAACVMWSHPAFGQASAPTEDQKAYNYVFDRLRQLFPSTPSEEVHLLNVMVPATWADPLNELDDNALFELQSIAGAIPDPVFALDPSRMKLRLDALYTDYVTQSIIPAKDDVDSQKLQDAVDKFTEASNEQKKLVGEFNDMWDARVVKLKNQGKPVTNQEKMRFRQQNGGMFASANNKISNAMRNINKYSDVNQKWLGASALLFKEVQGVAADGSGIYTYRGGAATLKSIQADCSDTELKGWDSLMFRSDTDSTSIRSSSWNASGGWSGGFFGINAGGGSTNYSKVIKTSSDSVGLDFCNLTYIRFDPGPWYDLTFLQAVDQGAIKLKPGALNYGKPVFGARGVIPRLVKGAIVARRVKFVATSDSAALSEVKTTSGGGGGFRIGGWGFGGAASSVKFDREYAGQVGSYGRSSNSNVPIIIALVTEPTTGSGDQPPPADTAMPQPSTGATHQNN